MATPFKKQIIRYYMPDGKRCRPGTPAPSSASRSRASIMGWSRSPAAVRNAVKRHRLPATGQGKARRFPKASVQALLDRQGQGASAQTRNYYRAHLRTFGNWLVRDRRLGENPFRHMEAENTTTDRRHDRRELPPMSCAACWKRREIAPVPSAA